MPDIARDPLRCPARRKPASRWVQVGVVVCGLAGGLVELLALQRRRLQERQRVAPAPWWY